MSTLIGLSVAAAYLVVGWFVAKPIARRVYLAMQRGHRMTGDDRKYRTGDLMVAAVAAVATALVWPAVGALLLVRAAVGRSIPEYRAVVVEDRSAELQERIDAQAAEITRLHRVLGVDAPRREAGG